MRRIAVVLILAFAPAAAASAQEPAPACAATNAALPAEFAGWTQTTPLAAATTPETAPKASLMVGKAAAATLPQTPTVTYALRPEKPGGSVSYGGLFGVDIEKAGTYAVALSTAAWIDVVRDGKAMMSTAHGRGPACSTIRKMVAFPLQPGRYVIQIAANGEPSLGIMVAPRP